MYHGRLGGAAAAYIAWAGMRMGGNHYLGQQHEVEVVDRYVVHNKDNFRRIAYWPWG